MINSEILSLTSVSKTYATAKGIRQVLKDLNFCLHEGEVVAVLGPNASGKSTLLKIALGLLPPETGVVKSVDSSHVSYIPQDYRNALFPWLSIRSNAALYTNSRDADTRQASPDKLLAGFKRFFTVHARLSQEVKEQLMDLSANVGFSMDLGKYPKELSGGEQQMFMLFLSMARRPRLLVADEPLSAVDIDKKERLIALVGEWLVSTQTTLLLVSHDIDEAVLLADRIVVLSNKDAEIHEAVPILKGRPRPYNWKYTEEFKQLRESVRQVLLH